MDTIGIVLAIGIATTGVIAVIGTRANHIHQSLVLMISVIEWIGRKQLGEYEPPSE